MLEVGLCFLITCPLSSAQLFFTSPADYPSVRISSNGICYFVVLCMLPLFYQLLGFYSLLHLFFFSFFFLQVIKLFLPLVCASVNFAYGEENISLGSQGHFYNQFQLQK